MKSLFVFHRAIAVILLNTLLLVCVLEAIMGVVRIANRDLREKRYVVANWATLSRAYPDLSQREVIQLVRESQGTTEFGYAPWVQFHLRAIKGRYVNSDGLRRRGGNSDDWSTAMPDGRHFDVYFFGGSTMYGFGVPDANTLPAQFQAQAPKEWKVRAFNFGQPYYYSRQETLLFENLLRNGHRPSAAVFLDGLNDAVEMTAAYLREPFFTPLAERRMAAPLDLLGFALDLNTVRGLRTIGLAPSPAELSHRYYKLPGGVPVEDVVNRTLENYLENLQFTQTLCDLYGVRCVFVWQPIPMVGYRRDSDTVSEQSPKRHVTMLYDKVRSMKDKPRGFVDFSRTLDEYAGQPFVDSFHYSGPFMAELAGRLLPYVQPRGTAPAFARDGT